MVEKKYQKVVPDDMKDLGGEFSHLFEIERQEDFLALLLAGIILVVIITLV
jgi:hypothetical protein